MRGLSSGAVGVHGATYPWEFQRDGEEVSVQVTGSVLVDDDDLKVRAARLGCGLAYASVWSVADDLRAGTLTRVLEDWTPAYGSLAVYYPGHRLVPATVRAFVEMVRAGGRRTKRPAGSSSG